ncbi:MAG: KpsF/GutQ family sugar-phosphate isomerase [Acidobacteria bacterium]|jgi:arabinose-5-phosphate isomerase|nr:KpsF/GutQ family sugar-phosphate isomerase [Acidobacteriota bacterium]
MGSIETGKKVLQTEANAILKALNRIDQRFADAVDILFHCRGQIVVAGMGKSGLVGRKIAATMTSTGSPAVFLHPAEAIHGDIGIIHPEDVVIVLSTSGETGEVTRMLDYIKRLGIKLVALVGNPRSTLARQSDVFIDCSVEKEACPTGLVPSASSTLALAVGDALSIALMEKRGFSEEDFRYFHPGGQIGKRLLKVKHLMHKGKQLPVADVAARMKGVIRVINEKKFGVAIVVRDGDRVAGIITDGDLRRLFLKGTDFARTSASSCMTAAPLCISEEKMAVEALKIMEDRAVTSLVVVDEKNRLRGLLHLHDLWRTEMI